MEIRTFTSFWNMERKLYAIYDISLPVPISLKVLGAFVATGIPWWLLLILLQVPFSNPWYLLYIAVPIPVAIAASRPIYQKKTFAQFAYSLIKHVWEPKQLAGLRNIDQPLDVEYEMKARVFKRPSNLSTTEPPFEPQKLST